MKDCGIKASNYDNLDASRIGVLGGTFNPIHVGHIAMARQAQREFALENVIVLVSGAPPHKHVAVSATHRLAMAALALRDEPGITLSSLEAERPGRTYTLDSLYALRERYPGKRLCYIIGADTLMDLPAWHKAGEVIGLCEFIVFYRLGAQLDRACEVQKALPGLRLSFAELNVPDVSSTEIRARVKCGASLRSLVCPAVETYIRQNGLYR